MKEVLIGADHGGFELKEDIKALLEEEGYQAIDVGTSTSDSVDYPDYGEKIAQSISKGENQRGILICGTGIGMSIVVNKFPNVRGALCGDIFSCKMSREHNDSNILILGGRVIGKGLAHEIVKTWLTTKFEGGRHQARLDKIKKIEKSLIKGEE
jgi:ribose 5-phosphate isomerase B